MKTWTWIEAAETLSTQDLDRLAYETGLCGKGPRWDMSKAEEFERACRKLQAERLGGKAVLS